MVSLEQLQQLSFELNEKMDMISSRVELTALGVGTTVNEKFAIAEIQFRAEQTRTTEMVNNLNSLIQNVNGEKMMEVASQIQALTTHEEERGKVLRTMFSEEATLVRTEMFKINGMLIENKVNAENALSQLAAQIAALAERPAAEHHFMGDQGGAGGQVRRGGIPRMRVPDPSGFNLRVLNIRKMDFMVGERHWSYRLDLCGWAWTRC